MRYALVDLTHADLLGEFTTLEEGERALADLVGEDPRAGEDVELVAHDDNGQPMEALGYEEVKDGRSQSRAQAGSLRAQSRRGQGTSFPQQGRHLEEKAE